MNLDEPLTWIAKDPDFWIGVANVLTIIAVVGASGLLICAVVSLIGNLMGADK